MSKYPFVQIFCLYYKTMALNFYAVRALGSIRRKLIDPKGNLNNWNSGDPCTSNWTGALCFNQPMDDGYLHIRELYNFFLILAFNLVLHSPAFKFSENSFSCVILFFVKDLGKLLPIVN